MYHAVIFGGTAPGGSLAGASTVIALITAGGTFMTQFNSVSRALNTVGSETNYINNQVSYNRDKIDALNAG